MQVTEPSCNEHTIYMVKATIYRLIGSKSIYRVDWYANKSDVHDYTIEQVDTQFALVFTDCVIGNPVKQ